MLVKNSQNQRYREGTCTKMSHEWDSTANMNLQVKWSNRSQVKVTSSQRCLDTFVIVTAHKQVCANQKLPASNMRKSTISMSALPTSWLKWFHTNARQRLTPDMLKRLGGNQTLESTQLLVTQHQKDGSVKLPDEQTELGRTAALHCVSQPAHHLGGPHQHWW